MKNLMSHARILRFYKFPEGRKRALNLFGVYAVSHAEISRAGKRVRGNQHQIVLKCFVAKSNRIVFKRLREDLEGSAGLYNGKAERNQFFVKKVHVGFVNGKIRSKIYGLRNRLLDQGCGAVMARAPGNLAAHVNNRLGIGVCGTSRYITDSFAGKGQ